MEQGRHSISVDREPVIHTYLAKHLENWAKRDLLDSHVPYRVIGEKDFRQHPIFSDEPVVTEAAE
jgi:hypothetical protein